MLNAEEKALIQKLGQCYSEYVRLSVPDMNDRDRQEFAGHIHDLQARVMWLAARRDNPLFLR